MTREEDFGLRGSAPPPSYPPLPPLPRLSRRTGEKEYRGSRGRDGLRQTLLLLLSRCIK